MRFPESVLCFSLLVVIGVASCSKDGHQVAEPVDTDSAIVVSKPLPSLDPAAATTLTDISYGSAAQQKLDLSLVGGRTGNTPLVILLHGGAWSGGDKKDLAGQAGYFVSRGINVVNVNYRLTNTSTKSVRWTGILSDVNAAVTYVRIHADSLKIRNTGFVLFGFSAGAQLALLHGYSYDENNLIAAVIGFGTPTKLNDRAWEFNPFLGVARQALPPLTGQSFTTDSNNVTLKELSPYFAPLLKPTLLIHGDQDNVVPYSQSLMMYAELNAKGIAASLITLTHAGHSGEGATQSDLNNALEACATWVGMYSH